jgi:hypothetical protein
MQTLRRFKGSDADLLGRYNQALADVVDYFGLEAAPPRKRAA